MAIGFTSLLTASLCLLASAVQAQDRAGAAPLPDAARGPAIPQDKGYLVEELGEGLYWITEGMYQTFFLTTGEGVVVVDAPPSLVQHILKAVSEVTDEPITHLVYSHSHADHIGGAGGFPEGLTVIAHEETAAQLADVGDPDRAYPYGIFVGGGPIPRPTVTFADEYTLRVGSQVLELKDHGPHHEPGNLYIYAPRQKVLMVVDIVFPGWVPFKSLALAEDTRGFVKAHDVILSYEFDHYIGGHWGRSGTRADVETQKAYIADVGANAAEALRSVDFMAIAQEIGFENVELLLDRYLDAVTQRCADLTVPKWVSRLGGADVFTFDHCHMLMQSIRID